MVIAHGLIAAYQHAEYVVFGDTEIVLLVDTYSAALHRTMIEKGVSQAAFISAFNPHSEILDGAENLKRHDALTKELNGLGFDFLPGLGRDKKGQWPDEKSVLVLNMPNDSAKTLANQYDQNAIIWIEQDAIPQLLLLEGKSEG